MSYKNYNKESERKMSVLHMEIKITEAMLDDANNEVLKTSNYGKEDKLIIDCLKRFPNNIDRAVVAMKIALIDVTNNTHLGQHKSKINLSELADKIIGIKDFDKRVEAGDPELVNEIVKSNDKINLFSFASKYCCYHNTNLYGKDDYSNYDTILKKNLSKYFGDITTYQLEKLRVNIDYKSYNDYIGSKLDELKIFCPFRRRKLDRFIWYKNR